MTRLMIPIAAAVAVVAAVPAGATKGTDKRVEAALACAGIADNSARLQCFDAAVANLKTAVETGTLVAEKTIGDPTSFEGVIRSSAGRGFNRFLVQLDNGDRWEIFANSSHDELPKAGAKVKFKKSPAGGYFYNEPGYPQRKARFIGRSDS